MLPWQAHPEFLMDILTVVAKKKESQPNPIGRRVKELRQGLFTQASLAEAVGVHRVHIARLETNADFSPSLELLQKLAGALRVTVSDLVIAVPTIPSKN